MEPLLGTVDKAIDILFHLHREVASRGVTEIGRALGIPKSSAHRLLAALRQRGLVEQDARGRYQPGIGLIALGVGVLEREPTVAVARSVLEREAESLGETFFLVGARAGQLVVLDKVEGTGFLRVAPRIGSTVPVHATAVGKLQLAFGAADVAFAADAKLESFTDLTLGGDALRRSVEEAREQGFASNVDEWIPGLSVLAAPIFRNGHLMAHVALAASSHRVVELGFDELAERVCNAADAISARFELGGPSR